MKIYSVINDALGTIYDDLPNHYADRDAAIWDALNRLTEKYGNLAYIEVDYSAPATKFAYLFKYAGSRACAVYSRQRIKKIADLYLANSLVVTSLGAGPGSDLLGILRRYVEEESQLNLEVNLVDLDATWKSTAQIVKDAACNHLEGCPRPTVRYCELDCSSDNVVAGLEPFKHSVLFCMSYLLSELAEVAAARLLNAILAIAKSGAVILVIDNNTESVRRMLGILAQNQEITNRGVQTEAIKLEYESVDNMDSHYERFGDHNKNGFPHIVLDAAYFVAKKK